MFFIIFLIVSGFVAYIGYSFYPEYEQMKIEAKQVLGKMDETTFKRLEPTQIVRRNGEVVREFTPAEYEYIDFTNIPSKVKQAFISIEDKNFYKHDGVDYKAIMRAGVALVKNKGSITQGGSTITQQLIKLTFLTNEQTYIRKIKEVFISWEIEKMLSKDTILEYYINNIYFGHGAYGFETASNYYFSKTSDELSLAEIAFLAAIPNNPTLFDPIDKKENTITRQTRILDHMLLDEVITDNEYYNAINEEIVLNIKEKEAYIPEDFEISFILHSAIEIIMEEEGFKLQYELSNEQRKIYQEEYNERYLEINKRIRQGGYTITSTVDPDKQMKLQKSVNQGLQRFTKVGEDGLYETQGAAVVIDNESHEVVAIVGGRTAENQVNTFNRAMLAYRQPGSIMKPIAAYGVEADIDLLGFSIYDDVKDDKGPKNSGGTYRGKMSARESLERSVNTIPFELVKNRGPRLVHKYLHKMRFNKITEDDLNAGVAIGGLTYGATPLEIAAAFSTLANEGEYVRLTGVSDMKFQDELIFSNNKEGVPVYKKGTAYLMTDMLKGVLESPRGTGKNMKLKKMPAAGKTGTTNENKDGWFAGYTPYYTTVVWVGNDVPKPIKGLFGSTYPGQIWKSYMEEIHKDLEIKDFKESNSVMTVYVANNKIYDYYVKGSVEEIMPIHMMDRYDVISKGKIEQMKKKEEEERLRQEKIKREEKEITFFEKYGISLKQEENEISKIESVINKILSIETKTDIDLEYSLNNLNQLLMDSNNKLYDVESQEHIVNQVNKARETLIKRHENMEETEELPIEEVENNEDEANDEAIEEDEESESNDE